MSPGDFDTVGEARAAVALVRSIAPHGSMGMVLDDRRIWRWRLSDGGRAVAEAHSGFARRLDAQRASDRFRRLADSATFDEQVAASDMPGRVRVSFTQPGTDRHGQRFR